MPVTYNGLSLDDFLKQMAEKNALPKEPRSPLMLKVIEALKKQMQRNS